MPLLRHKRQKQLPVSIIFFSSLVNYCFRSALICKYRHFCHILLFYATQKFLISNWVKRLVDATYGIYDGRYRKNPCLKIGEQACRFVTLPNNSLGIAILKTGGIMLTTIINSAVVPMIGPADIWYVIVGVLLVVLLAGSIKLAYRHSGRVHLRKPHFIEVGKEQDIFYVPGDEIYSDNENCLDDGF